MWEIFNVPSVQAVCYNTILNRKRELLNLVQGYEAKVSECNQNHCCKVMCCSSHTVQQQIFVSFLTDCHKISNPSLNISIDRSNLLELFNYYLMFIKKLDRKILCLLSNEKLYVKCKSSYCWILFYNLYHLLLKQPVKIIIGMQFYYSFACYRLITNELLLLNKITYFCYDSSCKFVHIIGSNSTCKSCISSSPLVEQAMEESSSKAVKRKNIDLLCQNQNEILLKRPKYFLSLMSSQVKLNPSSQASHCKNIKWKEFSALKSQVINYSSMLRKKSNPNKFKIFAAYQTEILSSFHNLEKICTNGNFTTSHPLTVVYQSEFFSKGNNNFNSDSFHPKYEYNMTRKRNSTTENFSTEPSKNSIENSELGIEADDFELKSSCSLSKLLPNKNTNSLISFKMANGKNISISQTALKSAQKILESVSVEENEITNFNSAKNDTSDTSDNITRNSYKEASKNAEKNSYSFLHDVQVNNFKLKSSYSLSNLQSNENDNVSLTGFKTANGRNINFSQSALKSAQKILQECSVEENDLSNCVSERNDKNDAPNCTTRNSCIRSSKNARKNSKSFPHRIKVDDFKLNSSSLWPNLQSNKNDNVSLTGFQTANGKNINFSQSALKSAQKILQEVSVDESITSDFDPEKCEDNFHNYRDSKENVNDYDNANDLEMDLDMAEKFFTDMSFDEDIEIISEHIKPPALFQSNCTVLHNTPSKKRKKSLGTRRVFEVASKKHKIFNS